jgi:hypothetical protein
MLIRGTAINAGAPPSTPHAVETGGGPRIICPHVKDHQALDRSRQGSRRVALEGILALYENNALRANLLNRKGDVAAAIVGAAGAR